jgi:ribosomal protein L11 methyltransferase
LADPVSRAWPAIALTRPAAGADAEAFGDRLALLLDDLAPIAVEDDEDGRHWRIHFDEVSIRDRAVVALHSALGHETSVDPIDVEDEGWAVRVQQELRAVRVGRLVVAPPWDVPPSGADDTSEATRPMVLVIEPSMGFGTGHHQSTRLCLEALQAQALDGARVIDIGTGSGVLALAAARLGARQVVAFDHDPDSVAAAIDNAARNALSARVDVRCADLAGGAGHSIVAGDVVLANLTAWVLRQHSATIRRLVRPEGRLVVSGFTRDQVALVADAFEDLAVLARYDEDDWVALALGRSQA